MTGMPKFGLFWISWGSSTAKHLIMEPFNNAYGPLRYNPRVDENSSMASSQ